MASRVSVLLYSLVFILGLNSQPIQDFQHYQTRLLAEDGCGPNQYAMFCLQSGYDLTVAHPLNEYVSNIRKKEMYDFLARSKCHKHIETLVCAALFPKCRESPFELMYPCKGLCKDVQGRCNPVLQRYQISWPQELNCTRFRERNCLNPETSLEERRERVVVDAPEGGHNRNLEQQPKKKPRRENKKHGQQNRKSPNNHAERKDRAENKGIQSEVQGASSKTMKMKTFLRLLKKTLDKVSSSLKTLSDGI